MHMMTSQAIWAASFNTEGTLLATGGQDMVVRVWKLYQAQGVW